MSFNVAMLEAMRAEGLDLDACIRIFRAAGPDTAADKRRAWDRERKAGYCPSRKAAANDRVKRPHSTSRRAIYSSLCGRDGEKCSECGCAPSTIWRRNGVTADEWGWQHTIVYPTTNLEVDHRKPLWAGGSNSIDNLWLLCIDCHKAKTAIEASQRRRA